MSSMTHTHSYAVLGVSKEVYDEISEKLKKAGWAHAFSAIEGAPIIDMYGIALKQETDDE